MQNTVYGVESSQKVRLVYSNKHASAIFGDRYMSALYQNK